VLATGTRWRRLLSHAVFAFLGPVVALAVAGVVTGLVHGPASGDAGGQALRLLGGTLAQAPAVWVLTLVAVLLGAAGLAGFRRRDLPA
jgi:ABC-2 type transport system permease protein